MVMVMYIGCMTLDNSQSYHEVCEVWRWEPSHTT